MPPTNWQRKREGGGKTYTLCVCLWSEISYNLLTTRPKQPSVNNVTSINTVFKQGRFYPLNPLQKGDETGDLLKGSAQTRTSRQRERGHLDTGPQFVTRGCDTALPSRDTAPGGCVIASSLPQGAQHTHSICLLLLLLNLSSSTIICPQITCPACMQWSFPLKTGPVPSCSPFRPSQGLTPLGGARWVLYHSACGFLIQHMGQAAPDQHYTNNPGL